VTDETMSCKSGWELAIPKQTDAFGKNAQIGVDLGDLIKILSWDEAALKIRSKGLPSDMTNGSYSIQVVMTDAAGYSERYNFKINVAC
jgi:hypothetical protein